MGKGRESINWTPLWQQRASGGHRPPVAPPYLAKPSWKPWWGIPHRAARSWCRVTNTTLGELVAEMVVAYKNRAKKELILRLEDIEVMDSMEMPQAFRKQ